MTDDDQESGSSDSRHLPDITFTLGRPAREPRLPFATPLPPAMDNIYFMNAIELDFHKYPMDCYRLPSYDWGAFDATSASFSRLGRVTFGFREKTDAQRFLGLDVDANTNTTLSGTTPESDEVHGLGTRMDQLGRANKIRCAYWDVQQDGYVRVPAEDTAQGTAKNGMPCSPPRKTNITHRVQLYTSPFWTASNSRNLILAQYQDRGTLLV